MSPSSPAPAARVPSPVPAPLPVVTWLAIGVAFWLAFVLVVRAIPGWFAEPDLRLAIVFAGAVPATVASVALVQRVLRLDDAVILEAVAVITLAAALCDGLAFGFGDVVYGLTGAPKARAAAWILWGAGLGMGEALRRRLRATGVRPPATH